MDTKPPAPGLKTPLRFPLQPEVLIAQGFMLLVAVPVFLARRFWGGDFSGDGLALLNLTGVTLFLTMLLEYGFSVIDASVRGVRNVPVFSLAFLTREIGSELADAIGNLGNIAGLKLVKQQIMVAAFLGLAWYLDQAGLALVSTLASLFFILVLPASMAINAMSGSLLTLLNPARLVRFAWEQGAAYGLCVLSLLGAWAFFMASLQDSLLIFLLFLPPGLYCAMLMFRLLGDCLHARRDQYFPRVDFAADRKALAALSKRREFLDRRLQAILAKVRNREVDQACRELDHFLASNDWNHFDAVFTAASAWPDLRPAQTVVRHYLPIAIDTRRYMQALDLCAWCLKQDAAFTLDDTARLLDLSDQAATRQQYRVMLQLLLNYADRQPGDAGPVLAKAAYLAATKLNDDRRLEEIMARMGES